MSVMIGIAHDPDVEPPVLIDAELPFVLGLAIFLSPQGRMAQVLKQKQRLLIKDPLDFRGRLLVCPVETVGEEEPSSCEAFNFFLYRLAGFPIQRCKELLVSVKRSVNPAMLDILIRFGQTSIDDPALSRSIFIVCVLELGAINHQLGSYDYLATLKREFHEIPLGEAGLVAEACRYGHLTLVLYLSDCVH